MICSMCFTVSCISAVCFVGGGVLCGRWCALWEVVCCVEVVCTLWEVVCCVEVVCCMEVVCCVEVVCAVGAGT